ncbi:right-handed parallel beta-helix repeat-containing protein [Plantactinospora soyae]|uniref:Parallel beta-helix repeat protein n=1 Tax=Plantactinospora soyae TaxID=1544732 RepID=A0A927RAT2_9ACTN|nr:right-handed parallel beta-helix repeat-containing protein [Plantactinospora soyae]MBE1491011.1 parallel beta-helix repeat protein [Plantactinospora soyae]
MQETERDIHASHGNLAWISTELGVRGGSHPPPRRERHRYGAASCLVSLTGTVHVSVRDPGRRALLYGAPAVAAGSVLLAGSRVDAAVAVAGAASPKDYGAVGNGVVDDTAAVQACLNANRVIDFGGPENTYLITTSLKVDKTATQVLIGNGASIKAGALTDMMEFYYAGHSVSGVVFDGNNQGRGVAIRIRGSAAGSSVDECAFVNVAGSGVVVEYGANRVRITNCRFRRCGHGTAIPEGQANLRNSVLVAADHCSVLDNELLECMWGVYFRAENDTGISFYTCRGNTITCLSDTLAGSQGISNRLGRNSRIQDNTIVGFNDNSIDCWGCNNMTITGNITSGGKDGVFIGDVNSSSITIAGNVFRAPQRGVRVVTAGTVYTNQLVIGVTVTGNTVSNPSIGGIYVGETTSNQLSGVTIADNDLHIARAGDYGIHVVNAECSRIAGNRIYRAKKHGIVLTGTDIVEVSNNMIQDASQAEAGTTTPAQSDGINVDGSNRALIRNNTIYGGARYAVNITGGTGMTVTGNRWRSTSAGLNIGSGTASPILSENVAI